MNPQRLANIGATATITIGLLSLLSWMLLRPLLNTGLIPDGLMVMPLSALIGIAMACGLLLVSRASPGYSARLCGGFVIVFSVVVLLEYLFRLQVGVEQYVFGDSVDSVLGGNSPGRPAPQSALIALFLGLALWFLSRPRASRHVLPDLGIGLALLMSFTILLGHFYQARALYQSAGGGDVGMSVLETVLLLILSLSALGLNPQGAIASLIRQNSVGTAKRRVLPVIIATPVALGFIEYLAVKVQALEFSVALALAVSANIVVFIALSEWVGRVLLRMEEARTGDFVQRETKAKAEGKTDMLTGLTNRRGWDQTVAEAEERCQRESLNACVIVIDLDGLKLINDTQGHAKGDEFIRRASLALRLGARREDCLARLGGDEFACLSVNLPPEHAGILLKRLSASLQKANVAASLGHAMRDLAGSIPAAFQEADHAMYAHKRARKTAAPLPAAAATRR